MPPTTYSLWKRVLFPVTFLPSLLTSFASNLALKFDVFFACTSSFCSLFQGYRYRYKNNGKFEPASHITPESIICLALEARGNPSPCLTIFMGKWKKKPSRPSCIGAYSPYQPSHTSPSFFLTHSCQNGSWSLKFSSPELRSLTICSRVHDALGKSVCSQSFLWPLLEKNFTT